MKKFLALAAISLSILACTLQSNLPSTAPAVTVVTSYKRACMVTTVHKAASIRYGGAEIVKP